MNDIIYNELKRLTEQALKENEVPVAAVIVENNKIIGTGYNQVEKFQNFMKHAEIVAIEEASKNKKNWRLNNCILYVTLEPCSMCKEIIKKSRISNVFYLSKQNNEIKDGEVQYNHIENKYFSEKLVNFFKTKRKF